VKGAPSGPAKMVLLLLFIFIPILFLILILLLILILYFSFVGSVVPRGPSPSRSSSSTTWICPPACGNCASARFSG